VGRKKIAGIFPAPLRTHGILLPVASARRAVAMFKDADGDVVERGAPGCDACLEGRHRPSGSAQPLRTRLTPPNRGRSKSVQADELRTFPGPGLNAPACTPQAPQRQESEKPLCSRPATNAPRGRGDDAFLFSTGTLSNQRSPTHAGHPASPPSFGREQEHPAGRISPCECRDASRYLKCMEAGTHAVARAANPALRRSH
jgi:hypothetical protein